jgi:hypothetical protein
MDALLPSPLPLFGTLIGIAVLMSASAAAAQGVQNLALGLKQRRYIPQSLGQQNEFEVADKPVWLMVALVTITYIFFGTNEETYLAILLSNLCGWRLYFIEHDRLGGNKTLASRSKRRICFFQSRINRRGHHICCPNQLCHHNYF